MTGNDLEGRKELERQLNQVIDRLRLALQEQYELLIFEPGLRVAEGEVELFGQVLTEKQRQQLLKSLREVYPGPLQDRLVVLEKAETGYPRYRLLAPAPPLDLWSAPASKRLATQILPGDPPFSVLLEMEGRLLARAADGSLGWIDKAALEDCLPTEDRPEFIHPPYPADPELEAKLRLAVWESGRSVLGAPYRLGGRDLQRGLDCSALAQYAYAQGSAALLPHPILLPKHSLDQMKAGLRIPQEEAQTGDLIFLRHPTKNYSHVAIYSGPDQELVTHASREAGKVVTEPAEQLLSRYRLLGFRTYFQRQE